MKAAGVGYIQQVNIEVIVAAVLHIIVRMTVVQLNALKNILAAPANDVFDGTTDDTKHLVVAVSVDA
jgi:hypothetical protein